MTGDCHTVVMPMYVKIYRDKAGEWRSSATAGNNEKFGDGYGSPSSAERGYLDELRAAVDAGYFFVDDYGNVHVDETAVEFRRVDPAARKS